METCEWQRRLGALPVRQLLPTPPAEIVSRETGTPERQRHLPAPKTTILKSLLLIVTQLALALPSELDPVVLTSEKPSRTCLRSRRSRKVLWRLLNVPTKKIKIKIKWCQKCTTDLPKFPHFSLTLPQGPAFWSACTLAALSPRSVFFVLRCAWDMYDH